MASSDEPQGVSAPSGETVHEAAPESPGAPHIPLYDENPSYSEEWSTPGVSVTEHAPPVSYSITETSVITAPPVAAPPVAAPGGNGKPPKPPKPPDEEDDEDEGMARMSFLEHLEELRKRLLLAIGGV